MVYFITGLPGVGKTTASKNLGRILESQGRSVIYLDGDNVRKMYPNIGYTKSARLESCRRVFKLTKMWSDDGHDVIVSIVAPLASTRDMFRRHKFKGGYIEILLNEIYQKRPDNYYCHYEASFIRPELTGREQLQDFLQKLERLGKDEQD